MTLRMPFGTGMLLAAALAAPAAALPTAQAPPAPWNRILADLRQWERSRLAPRALLGGDCTQDCYTRYNERLIQCSALPRGGLRVACIAQADAEFDACAAACEGH